eukprot:scaffold310_cov335-Pavlova_lutheri.AAC.12
MDEDDDGDGSWRWRWQIGFIDGCWPWTRWRGWRRCGPAPTRANPDPWSEPRWTAVPKASTCGNCDACACVESCCACDACQGTEDEPPETRLAPCASPSASNCPEGFENGRPRRPRECCNDLGRASNSQDDPSSPATNPQEGLGFGSPAPLGSNACRSPCNRTFPPCRRRRRNAPCESTTRPRDSTRRVPESATKRTGSSP